MTEDNPFKLNPDQTEEINIDNNLFRFKSLADCSALLKLSISSKNIRSWFREPFLTVKAPDNNQRTQYLPPRYKGSVYVDLSWIANSEPETFSIEIKGAVFENKALLMYFSQNDPVELGNTLIIAPHPDDGELCCTSFYGPNSYLVTLSAGEKVKELKKQYFTMMDQDIEQASLRKGHLRAFNSVTTGMLGDISAEHMINLGYFDATFSDMRKFQDKVIKSNHNHQVNEFRKFNPKNSPFTLIKEPVNQYKDLLADLTTVIQTVNPARIIVTNPNADTHQDHAAAGEIILELLDQIPNNVRKVYLYSIHIKREKPIYFGPALNHIGMPFVPSVKTDKNNTFSYRSFELSEEQQKRKTIMLNLMYDTYKEKDHRFQKCATHEYINSARLGKAYYIQRFIKQNEIFLVINRSKKVNDP